MTHPSCKKRYTIDGAVASIVYEGIVKRLIYRFKYAPYTADLVGVLSELFSEGIIQKEAIMHVLALYPDSVLVPIPLHPARLKKRGYNHAMLLAQRLGAHLGLPVQDILKRQKQTLVQASLSLEQRQENLRNAFMINARVGKGYTTVFLVDDLVTTGTTFLESAKVLKMHGVQRVYGVALARGK